MSERRSNFELLRILAIFLIIFFHYCIHGNNGIILKADLSINQFISILVGSWGIVGVVIFVFISSYFLIDSSSYKIEKVIVTALTTSFYAVLLLCIMCVTKVIHFDIKSIVYAILSPLMDDQYWFIPSYLMLFIIYPFLNKFIKVIPRKSLYWLLVVLTCLIPFYKTIISTAPIQCFGFFIYLYLLMGYLKATPNNIFERNSKKGFIIVVMLVLTEYVVLCFIEQYMHIHLYYGVFVRTIGRYSPIMILLAIFLFYIFKDLKIPHSKLINTIARSTLGIYLIHENPSLGRILWDRILHVDVVYYRKLYILYILLSVIVIWAMCLIIDIIRIRILEKYIVTPCLKHSKLVDRINKRYNEIIVTFINKES